MSLASIVAADLAYMLGDVGVVVVHAAVTTSGKKRRTPVKTETDTGLQKIAEMDTVLVRDGVLVNPLIDDAITIDGVACVIRDVDPPAPDGSVLITYVPST